MGVERLMAHFGLKQALLALLLLVFLNQWVAASTMHCVSSRPDPHAVHTMEEGTRHAHHGEPQASEEASPETAFDCCEMVNHCLSGSCLVPPMAHDVSPATAVSQSAIMPFSDNTALPSPISSLYRPPIFR